MGNYSCENCGKTFNGKQNLSNHIKNNVCGEKIKKINIFKCNECERIFFDKKGLTYHTSKNVCTQIKIYTCDICDKTYANNSGLWAHKKKCKNVVDPEAKLARKLKEMEHKIRIEMENKMRTEMERNMQAMMDKMRSELESNIVNNNINNNNKTKINNNTINVNNNNIVLVKFGDEDLSKLTQTELYHVLNEGFYAANALVKKMHFDPNIPEYHNVCFSNLKDNYGSIYNGKEWVIQNKKDIIDKLIDDKRLLIECSKDTKAFKKLEVLKQEAVLRMLDFDVDNEHIIVTKKDLVIMMYNNRKFPQQAIKK